MPDTAGWPSIFDLAASVAFGNAWPPPTDQPLPQRSAALDALQDQIHLAVERSAGLVRCRRLHHTDTQAWRDQEAARRARQVLPPPPKQGFRLKRRLG